MVFRRKDQPARPTEVLFDPSAVDLVALSPDGLAVELNFVADAPWTGSDAQIRSLQEKIHSYVSFAADGQLSASYPEAARLRWRIIVRCGAGEPDERTADVLRRTAAPVRDHGGDLEVRT